MRRRHRNTPKACFTSPGQGETSQGAALLYISHQGNTSLRSKTAKELDIIAQNKTKTKQGNPDIIDITLPEKKKQKTKPAEVGHVDAPFVVLTLLLLAVGLVCLYSASYPLAYSKHGNSLYFVTRQGLFALAGVVGMFLISRMNYHKFHYFAVPALIATLLLMATIKIPGLSSMWKTINSATRWMQIGPISLQPSELCKAAVILSFSSMAAMLGKKKMHTLRWGILPFMGIIVLIALLLYFERHLSGTLIIAAIGMVIIFLAGANMAWFFAGGGAVAVAAVAYVVKNPYALTRFKVWLDPFIDPLGKGFQGSQSLITIGSGGLWGVGLGQGTQKHLFLPEPTNDFIFPTICEELGLVGASMILLLFAALILRGYYIALRCENRFGTLLAAGVTTHLAIQIIMNLFVVTGIMPITGASLPFFSYGGTALLIQMAEAGILLSISRELPGALYTIQEARL